LEDNKRSSRRRCLRRQAVAADKRINRFFANTDMPRLKRRLVEPIYAGAGGPCEYKAAA